MGRSDEIKNLLLYTTNQIFKIVERIIDCVPDEQISFKPHDKSMPFGHLSVHLYNMCYLYLIGPISGDFDHSNFDDLFCDPRQVTTKEEILEYAKAVKGKIVNSMELITDQILDNEIEFNFSNAPESHFTSGWGTWKLGAYSSLFSILEESINHRGQLNLYLRIMGIETVFVYD